MAKKETETQTQEETQRAWNWKERAQEAAEKPDIVPLLKIGPEDGAVEQATVVFQESEPRLVHFVKDGEAKEFPIINVLHVESGQMLGLAVSATTIQDGIGRLSVQHGNDLKGVKALIGYRMYKHKDYGTTKGFTVVPIQEENVD